MKYCINIPDTIEKKKLYSRRRWVKRGMKTGGRIPEPRVRGAGEGGEGGGGELHRVEERVGRLLLVRHLGGPTIQRLLPTSLFWLRLQSSGSAGGGQRATSLPGYLLATN